MLGLVRPDAGRQVLFRNVPLDQEALRKARTQMKATSCRTAACSRTLPRRSTTCGLHGAPLCAGPEERIRARVAGARRARAPAPDDALARHPSALSGGQRQRVALMRALMLARSRAAVPRRAARRSSIRSCAPSSRTISRRSSRGSASRWCSSRTISPRRPSSATCSCSCRTATYIVQRGALDDLVARPASTFVTRFVRAQRRLDVDEAESVKALSFSASPRRASSASSRAGTLTPTRTKSCASPRRRSRSR